jgi:nuclease S1
MVRQINARQRLSMVMLCLFVLNSVRAWGWSAEAHRAIAIIATNRLMGTNTGTRIKALLGNLALADIATCPDEVRDLEEYHTKMSPNCSKLFPVPPKGTANWHFVDTPIKDAAFTPTSVDVDAACANQCALIQIQTFLAVLGAAKSTDTPAQKLKEMQALSYVVHFIGDVHQPLHAADRDGDHGGNAEVVSFFGNDSGGKLKLHTIWDNQIVLRVDSTDTKLASDLANEISQAAREPAQDQMGWALESYGYARDVAYSGIPPANGTKDVAALGQPYQDAAAPVVRIQIARAGVRLADALRMALP